MENAYSSLDQSRSFLQHNPLARLLTAGLLLPCLTLWGPGLQANPSGGAVALGDVTIGTGAGGQLDITQGSDRAIIHWDDFSIDAGQTTRFIQPGTSSIALNRVTGGNPTAIFGALQGNGHVFVINPNGILVGAGGTIDVHGLALSTLDVSNGEFLAGGELLFQGGTQTGVTNMGRINAIGGDVFLIGKTVSNSGSISARDGTVGLAAGEEVLLTAANGPEGERLFVRAGGAGVSGTGIFNDGTIEGAAVELKAHGNVYAMAINNKGSIRAIGTDTSGGRVFLQGAGGRVSNSGLISSRSGDPNKAASLLIQAAYAKVDGELIAANAAGIGGNITVEGTETVEVGSNARIDASGSAGGGSVRIGGGFQGRDVSMANAKNTTVAEGSLIIADATESGDAGTVIVWADQDTVYEGEISAQAAGVGNGGFVEVSGKENLTFDGVVSTLSVSGRNGTLLLDPTNLTVSTAAASANNVNVTSLTTAVGSNNVVISTDPAGVQDGNITVSNDVLYTSTNSLTFLAHGDAIFNASVQNAGAGAVNIVAGWNGTTGFTATSPFGLQNGAGFNLATILAAPASFGNAKPNGGNGSVRIDSSVGSTAAIVAVASRGGTTTVLGHGLTLQSGSATGIDATQLGFRPTDNTQVTGAIDIYLKAGGLSILGGTTDDFAQIGHGGTGSFASAGVNAPITVSFVEAGDVNLVTSTSSNNHAQIGHGGRSQISTVAGAITIRGIGGVAGASNLTLSSRGQLAYAQIGHGGGRTAANNTGDPVGSALNSNISLNIIGAISLSGRPDVASGQSYAQIGHGGHDTENFSTSGSISINTAANTGTGDILLTGGGGGNHYAMIGHGGSDADETILSPRTGDITIGRARDIIMQGAVGTSGGDAFVQIGHGGDDSGGAANGNIRINASGAVSLTGGVATGGDAYAQIGHGGHSTRNPGAQGLSTDVLQVNAASISLTAGTGVRNYAQIGHGGGITTPAVGGALAGEIIVSATSGNITLTGGAGATPPDGITLYAMIGHGSGDNTAGGTRQGGVQIFANGTLHVTNGTGQTNAFVYHQTTNTGGLGGTGNYLGGNGFQLVGLGGVAITDASLSFLDTMIEGNIGNGPIFVALSNNLDLTLDGPAALANDTFNRTVAIGGNVNVQSSIQNNGTGNISLLAGYSGAGTVGGSTTFSTLTNVVTITGSLAIDFTSPTPIFGLNSRIITIGSTTQTVGVALGSRGGITAIGGSGVALQASTGTANAYSQIGYRPTSTTAVAGAITVGTRTGGLVMNSGAAAGAFTTVGHGGTGLSNAAIDAPITISFAEAGVLDLNAGTGAGSFAQIGHGLSGGTLTKGGAITITNFGVATMDGGGTGGTGSFGQIGHGGIGNSGNLSGSVTLTGNATSGSLAVRAGTASQSFAQIGHGGGSGTKSGIISISNFTAASLAGGGVGGTGSFAQIGHGGVGNSGNLSGAVTLSGNSTGSLLTVRAGAADQTFAQIGHGGGTASATKSGIISVSNFSTATLDGGTGGTGAFAQIGHGGISNSGDLSDAITLTGNATSSSLAVRAGTATQSYAQIGHGGFGGSGNKLGVISVTSAGSVNLSGGGTGGDASAQIGHGGSSSGTINGSTTVSGTSVTIQTGSGANSYALIGAGGGVNIDGVTTISSTSVTATSGGVTVNATGAGGNGYAQIGAGGLGGSGSITGTTTVLSSGAILVQAGSVGNASARIGSGGSGRDGTRIDTGVDVTGFSVTVAGGSGASASAQIGSGGGATSGANAVVGTTITGNVLVRATTGNVSLTGGSGPSAFAQIGHGGNNSTGTNLGGDILVRSAAGSVAIDATAPGGTQGYAQIGHGGFNADFTSGIAGSVTVDASSNVTLQGGSAAEKFAQIGHGGINSDAAMQGNITVSANSGNVGVTGGTLATTYAQIGHGSGTGTRQGGVQIFASGTLTATNGTGQTNAFLYHQTGSAGGLGGTGNYLGGNGFQLVGRGGVTIANSSLAFLDTMIESNLVPGPVFVALSNDLDLTIDGPVAFVNDSFNRTIAIGGDINVFSSIQNFGLGDITLVAGYSGAGPVSGSSAFNGTTNLATITGSLAINFASPTPAFGLDTGILTLGRTAQTTRTTVGVRQGNNLFAGHRIALVGGSTADASSQLGFRDQLGTYLSGPTDLSAGLTETTSAINAYVRSGGLSLASGSAARAYTQIGHGGFGANDNAQSNAARTLINITFVNPGDVELLAGAATQSYAQIGHGAISTTAVRDRRGDISLTGFDDLLVRSGAGSQSFAMIGHGGAEATSGALSGDIDVHGLSGSVTLDTSVSSGTSAYAQIGHGGFLTSASSGVIDGNICVVTGTTLSLGASGGAGSYSQIGHGGVNRQGNFSGDVVVTTGIAGAGAVSLAGGTASNAYAQIGHGGINANGLLSGDIYVVADRTGMSGADISITGGSLTSTYGMIGHGDSEGVTSRGRREGGIHLFAAGDFTVTNGSSGPNTNYYHQTGNTGGLAANYDGGDGFQVVVNGTTSVASSAEDDVNFFIADSLGSGPVFIQRSDDFNVLIDDQDRFVDTSSDFFIVTGGSITLLRSYQNSGTGRVILVAGWDGGGTLSPGTVSYAALGGGGFNYCLPSITAGRRDVDFTNGASFGNEIDGGDALFGTVTIGSADQNNPVVVGSRGGDTVILGYGLTVAAGDSVGAYSQIGFRPNASGAVASDINIRLKQGGLTLAGGTAGGTAAFAQIGHGGATTSATGILEGDITIDFSNPGALQLSGGANPFAYAQIGHGGGNARGSEFRGDISIRGASDVGLIAGTLTATYAQIGHGGYSTDVNQSGKIEVFSLGEINLSATPPASPATAFSAYALIGHGDDVRGTIAVFAGTGTRAGNVQVGAGTNLTLTSSSIGHGSAATGSVAGTTEVAVSQNAPSDPSGGNLIADAHSELSSGSASGDALQFYLPQRSNNLIAAGATLNGESFLGAGVDPTDVLREDEFTLSIIGPGGPVVPTAAQLAGTFGAGAAPINAARFAFNHDTVQLRASSTRPLSTIGRFNNDRTINEDRRDDEADYTGFEPVRFFYEGFDQYDWSGASSYKGGMVPAP
jgi:filamentous hemagglutinin family protein